MTAVSGQQQATPRYDSRRALVVDGDAMVAELVRVGLETEGIEVVTAADGHKAQERLTQVVPDVIVSDINIPRMDGFALVSRLRAEPLTGNVPLIFLTSLVSPEDVAHGLRLGADDYVRTPFSLDEVIARVLAKLERPTMSVDTMVRDARTGLLNRAAIEEVRRETGRARRTGQPSAMALIDIDDRALLRERFGVAGRGGARDPDGRSGDERRLPLDRVGRDEAAPRSGLGNLAEGLAGRRLVVAGERVQVSPVVGWTDLDGEGTDLPAHEVLERALAAASMHFDLQPVR